MLILPQGIGASFLHKRQSFADIATRNRSIIIATERKTGDWRVRDVDTTGFQELIRDCPPYPEDIAEWVFEEVLLVERVSDRTLDTWRPVIRIAEGLSDLGYLLDCIVMLKQERLKVIADDEPSAIAAQALLSAYIPTVQLDNPNYQPGYTRNVKLSEVVEAAKYRLCVRMSPQRLKNNLRELGYEIKFYRGVNWVKANPELTQRLAQRYQG